MKKSMENAHSNEFVRGISVTSEPVVSILRASRIRLISELRGMKEKRTRQGVKMLAFAIFLGFLIASFGNKTGT